MGTCLHFPIFLIGSGTILTPYGATQQNWSQYLNYFSSHHAHNMNRLCEQSSSLCNRGPINYCRALFLETSRAVIDVVDILQRRKQYMLQVYCQLTADCCCLLILKQLIGSRVCVATKTLCSVRRRWWNWTGGWPPSTTSWRSQSWAGNNWRCPTRNCWASLRCDQCETHTHISATTVLTRGIN